MANFPNQEFREVRLITIKRLHIKNLNPSTAISALSKQDKQNIEYGHWWIEIGDPYDPKSESYGWWPKRPVNLMETVIGVEGELNLTSWNKGGSNNRIRDNQGLAIQDPHHGDRADETFHPIVCFKDNRSDNEIADCIRHHARKYNGEWKWFFEAGQNCHTFQLALLEACKLLEPEGHNSNISPKKY